MPELAIDQEAASRVLLVEDVAAMRLYIRLILERAGFAVTEAASLREAANYLRDGNCPTSVLLDLELPDGNGLDIMRQLPPGVPVVALSADESREAELQCRNAGCAAMLRKGEKLSGLGTFMTGIEGRHPTPSAATHEEPDLAGQYRLYLVETRVDLQRAGDRKDFEKVRQIAHRLRGTAIHFGYVGVGAGARNMGQAIASGNVDRIESALDELIERLLDAADSRRGR